MMVKPVKPNQRHQRVDPHSPVMRCEHRDPALPDVEVVAARYGVGEPEEGWGPVVASLRIAKCRVAR